MLHRVRRAERMLLSYERTGWLDNTPARVTGALHAAVGGTWLCYLRSLQPKASPTPTLPLLPL